MMDTPSESSKSICMISLPQSDTFLKIATYINLIICDWICENHPYRNPFYGSTLKLHSSSYCPSTPSTWV